MPETGLNMSVAIQIEFVPVPSRRRVVGFDLKIGENGAYDEIRFWSVLGL